MLLLARLLLNGVLRLPSEAKKTRYEDDIPVNEREKEKTVLSCQELGPLMGVTRQTVRNWIDKGDIRALHNGRRFQIPVEEALRILQHYELPVPEWLENSHPSL